MRSRLSQYPYAVALALSATALAAAAVCAYTQDLSFHDPDGIGGPPWFRISALLLVCVSLDLLPRAIRAGRGRPGACWQALKQLAAARWSRPRVTCVAAGALAFYGSYLAYRNFKSWLPQLAPGLHDRQLAQMDLRLLGQHPAELLHDLLGTTWAAHVLSWVYVSYLLFVPLSLTATLVWFGRTHQGLWYATSLCLNWLLGAASYYLLPALGPVFAQPHVFAELPATAASGLQDSLASQRQAALAGQPGAFSSIAAFASLHVSVVMTAALISARTAAPAWLVRGLWAYLAATVLATVYLGWHYLLDIPGGMLIAYVAVAGGAWATGHRFSKRAANA